MNILHLVYDEKFITFMADLFAECGGTQNRYLVIGGAPNAPFKHIGGLSNARSVNRRYFRSQEMERDLSWCDCLIVHYLGKPGARLILSAPKRVAVVWSGWGGDYYGLLPDSAETLLGSATQKLIGEFARGKPGLLGMFTARPVAALRRLSRKFLADPLLRRAIRRADYFSAPIREDFEVLKSALPFDLRAEYVQLNYGSVERTFAPGAQELTGNSILVGNSASPTNNHLEVFAILSRADLDDRDVVVPLSYGDAAYRDAVITRGRRIFGDQLRPIVDYLPLEKYNALVGGCSVAVMGHRRQQGIGNVVTSLLLGARVFMDPKSTLYQCLTHRGAIVFRLDEFADRSDALKRLTPEEEQTNRQVVHGLWGHDVVAGNVRSFVARLRPGSARPSA